MLPLESHMTRKRSCVVREGAERKGPVTEPRSPPTSCQGDGAAIVIAGVTTRLGAWEGHVQGEVPQGRVLDTEVGLDGPEDFGRKGHKCPGELTALKGARLVRGRVVGNVLARVTRRPPIPLRPNGIST